MKNDWSLLRYYKKKPYVHQQCVLEICFLWYLLKERLTFSLDKPVSFV